MWFTSSIQCSEVGRVSHRHVPLPFHSYCLPPSQCLCPCTAAGSSQRHSPLQSSLHPPTVMQNLPKAWPRSHNKPAKKRSKASPACNRTWSGPSYSFSSASLPNKTYSRTKFMAQSSHPGLQCSLFPQPWDSSCLLSCCFMVRRGRRTITTAPNMSTKQTEPYPGRRSAVRLWLASSTPSHSPGLDSRRCKQSHTILPTPLPPFLPENQS